MSIENENEMMGRIRLSYHGKVFTETVTKVLITINERILMEDEDGLMWLDRVAVVLNHYIEFRIRDAIFSFKVIQWGLHEFVSNLRWDQSNSTSRVRTWDMIERILTFLVKDGELFIEIATSALRP
jgi:hypothetical protein